MDNGNERRNWSMETHNLALTAMNTIEFHLKECERRDERLTARYEKIEKILSAQDDKYEETRGQVQNIQVKAAFALGGFISVWELVKLALDHFR